MLAALLLILAGVALASAAGVFIATKFEDEGGEP